MWHFVTLGGLSSIWYCQKVRIFWGNNFFSPNLVHVKFMTFYMSAVQGWATASYIKALGLGTVFNFDLTTTQPNSPNMNLLKITLKPWS